jgi:hypothetical protein
MMLCATPWTNRGRAKAERKVLGSDAINMISGRGYQFILPATKDEAEAKRWSGSKHNLPYQLTSFVGREQESRSSRS